MLLRPVHFVLRGTCRVACVVGCGIDSADLSIELEPGDFFPSDGDFLGFASPEDVPHDPTGRNQTWHFADECRCRH
jgi:hypothetical protein